MNDTIFTGREQELSELNELLNKKTASLVVIKGRRRIGKTRLIEEFAKGKSFLRFAGLAPTARLTAQSQRDEFVRLLAEQTTLPEIKIDDWGKLFALLAEHIKTGQHIILLDEITWMADGDDAFLSKLKNAWELYFKHNPKLILILCGSISAWIEKNILSSTGYFGRISKKITLHELSLKYCNELLEATGFKRSAYEKFLVLSLTGGVPWYIELLSPKHSAIDNIKNLCFRADGVLVNEHKYIFHDLFGKRSEIYEKITHFLAVGSAEYSSIANGINYTSSGKLTEYLDELIESGYVSQHFSWSLQSGNDKKYSIYRLSDHYLRFYYKYIQPKLNLIHRDQYLNVSLAALPAWSSVAGLQFENLVLTNRNLILQQLRIAPEEIVNDNPYYQRQTKRNPGCQIDYLIQTRLNTLFVCEIKFSLSPIRSQVISEVREKIKKLAVPRNFVCVPILIHINGVTEDLMDADYFYKIIDFSEFLKEST